MNIIEILIICAIIGILAGISLPLYGNFKSTLALNRASQELISSLRQTQQQAITENPPTGQEKFLDFEEFILPEGVVFAEISFPGKKVKFKSDGSVQKSGYVILKAGDKTTKISISISGYVKKE